MNAAKQQSNVPTLVCALMASLATGGTLWALVLYGYFKQPTEPEYLQEAVRYQIRKVLVRAPLFSWIPGLCVDRFGTRFSLSLGGVLVASFLLSLWTIARQFIVVPGEQLVTLLRILGAAIVLSNALIIGSVFKIIDSTCGPGTKACAVGVAKGYCVLGMQAFASIFESIQQPGESSFDFFPMAALFAIALVTIPGLIILPSKRDVTAQPAKDETTPLHFKTRYCLLLSMALIMANIMFDCGIAFLMVTICLGPIAALFYLSRYTQDECVVSEVEFTEIYHELRQLDMIDDHPDSLTKDQRITIRSDSNSSDVDQGTEDVLSNYSNLDRGEDQLHLLHVHEPGERYESRPVQDKNLIQMLCTPSAFLILCTTTILAGAGYVVMTHMLQMVGALRFSISVESTVEIASLRLFYGARVGALVATGALSEVALGWKTRACGVDKGIPRPFFLVVASIMTFFAHLILALARSPAFFLIGIVMSGVASGMIVPLMVLITGEIFGSGHIGAPITCFCMISHTHWVIGYLPQCLRLHQLFLVPSTRPASKKHILSFVAWHSAALARVWPLCTRHDMRTIAKIE